MLAIESKGSVIVIDPLHEFDHWSQKGAPIPIPVQVKKNDEVDGDTEGGWGKGFRLVPKVQTETKPKYTYHWFED